MAHTIFCPHCAKETDCIKKGQVNGKQRWKCKSCKKVFTETPHNNNQNNNIKKKKEKRTKILLNGNIITTVETKLSLEEAKKVLQMYINADCNEPSVTTEGDVIVFSFHTNLGEKG